MKTAENKEPIYILAFDSGAKGTKYISECDDIYGTSNPDSAMQFKSKEEAQIFNDEHAYLCWVEELD